jgi:hypothetical protein
MVVAYLVSNFCNFLKKCTIVFAISLYLGTSLWCQLSFLSNSVWDRLYQCNHNGTRSSFRASAKGAFCLDFPSLSNIQSFSILVFMVSSISQALLINFKCALYEVPGCWASRYSSCVNFPACWSFAQSNIAELAARMGALCCLLHCGSNRPGLVRFCACLAWFLCRFVLFT